MFASSANPTDSDRIWAYAESAVAIDRCDRLATARAGAERPARSETGHNKTGHNISVGDWPQLMQARLDCFGLTDRGRQRPSNQDHFLVADLNKSMRVHATSLGLDHQTRIYGGSQGKLLVVADGMGGEAEGERASTLAVDQLMTYMLNSLSWCFRLEEDSEDNFEEHLKDALRSCQESLQAVASAAGNEKHGDHDDAGLHRVAAGVCRARGGQPLLFAARQPIGASNDRPHDGHDSRWKREDGSSGGPPDAAWGMRDGTRSAAATAS